MTLLPLRSVGDGDPAADINVVVAAVDLKVDRGERFVNVTDYGAVCDLSADDTAEIQAAIDAAHAAGGGDVLIPGESRISTTLTMYTNVFLIGLGGEDQHESGSMFSQTRSALYWYGSAGGTMIDFSSVVDAAGQKSIGGGLTNLALHSGYGSNKAGVAVKIRSWNAGQWTNVYVHEFTDVAWDIGCLPQGSLGETHDSQKNEFSRLRGRQTLGGRFMKLDGNYIVAGPTTHGNVSCNKFDSIDISCEQPTTATAGVFDLWDCDNNRFTRIRTNCNSATNAIIAHASPANPNGARYNIFDGVAISSLGLIKSNGTEEDAFPAHGNVFENCDGGSSMQTPTLGTGATATWSFATGHHANLSFEHMAIGTSRTTGEAGQVAIGNESVRVVNGASDHVRLSDVAGTNVWGIGIDGGTGGLRLIRFAGAGQLQFAAAKCSSSIGFNGVAAPTWPAAYTQTYATASRTHPALTSLAAPAGGTGTAAGGWDTAANRDLAIATINALRTDVDNLKQLVNQILDDLQLYGILR